MNFMPFDSFWKIIVCDSKYFYNEKSVKKYGINLAIHSSNVKLNHFQTVSKCNHETFKRTFKYNYKFLKGLYLRENAKIKKICWLYTT